MELFKKRDIFDKIVEITELAAICDIIKRGGQTISCTSGAFDILHDGHIRYLMKAAEFGNVLIVGIDDDQLVRDLKGDSRPILTGDIRVRVIAAHEHVDIACLIPSSREMIEVVKPDVFIISQSTTVVGDREEELNLVESLGGKVIALPPMSSLHSTEIIGRLGK